MTNSTSAMGTSVFGPQELLREARSVAKQHGERYRCWTLRISTHDDGREATTLLVHTETREGTPNVRTCRL